MIPRLFTPSPLAVGATIQLDAATAHHAARVLRLSIGAVVELFDGDGHAAAASIVSARTGTVRVEQLLPTEPVPALRITLAQCISASDKMDWTIEKAVELGVSEIVPLQSQKAIVRLTATRSLKRHEHWQRLIRAACAQCGRNRVPRLETVAPLSDWLKQAPAAMPHAPAHQPAGRILRIVLAPRASDSLSGLLAAKDAAGAGEERSGRRSVGEVWLLCGPESGLSQAEYLQACGAGWTPAGLGPRVLRTETAGLVALAVLQARWGDLV